MSRFRFVLSTTEVSRFHIWVRRGDQGMMLKLTDRAAQKLEERMAKAKEKHGEVVYRFDYSTQEAVIEKVTWED